MADNNLTTKEEFLLNPVEEHNITDAAIASFETNLKHPLKVTVPITPQQDLHGYDHPWPAGSSVNLIPDGRDASNGYLASGYLNADGTTSAGSGWYVTEYFPVSAGATYMWSTNQPSVGAAATCFYDENKQYISGEAANGKLPKTIVAPENAVYCRSSQLTTGKLCQIENGTVAHSIVPYSNICPITGFTSDTIVRNGKNLYIYGTNTPRQNNHSSYIYPYGNSNKGRYVYLKPGTYTLTFYKQSGNSVLLGMYQSMNGGTVGRLGNNEVWNTKITRTIVSTGAWYNFYLYGSDLTTDYTYYFQIEVGSASTSYEPYMGQIIPITFANPTTGDPMTVYGGSLTLNEDGSADLSKTHVKLVIDGSKYAIGAINTNEERTAFRISASDVTVDEIWPNRGQSLKTGAIANWATEAYQQYGHNAESIAFHLNTFALSGTYRSYRQIGIAINPILDATETDIRNYLAQNPLEICYPLSTPIAYHFPNVGQLKAFLGENNVWSDIGNVDVKYLTQHSETGLEYRGDRALELRRRAMMADAPTIHTTVGSEETGGLASFKSYVKAPVKKIEIPFSPKQDLHGYDNPWPAGGSNNIADINNPVSASANIMAENGVITSAQPSGQGSTRFIAYTVAGLTVGTSYYLSVRILTNSTGDRITLRATSGGEGSAQTGFAATGYIGFTFEATDTTVNFRIVQSSNGSWTASELQLEVGTARTAFVPYENICPIEGWTGANIEQSKSDNLLYLPDGALSGGNRRTTSITDGVFSVVIGSGGISTSQCVSFGTVPTFRRRIPQGTYVFRIFNLNSASLNEANMRLHYSEDGVSKTVVNGGMFIVTAENGALYSAIHNTSQITYSAGTSTFSASITPVALDTNTYVNAIRATLPITFTDPNTSDPMTLYGGTITINPDGSADVVSKWRLFDLGNITWRVDGNRSTHYYATVSTIVKNNNNIIATCYKSVNPQGIGAWRMDKRDLIIGERSSTEVAIIDTNYNNNAQGLKTSLNGQYAIILTPPTTYHFSNLEQLKVWLGENNFWCDISDDITVKYWNRG